MILDEMKNVKEPNKAENDEELRKALDNTKYQGT